MSAEENLSPHQFDVEVSDHDSLRKGITAKKVMGSQHRHHRIVLSGEYSHNDAMLIAAQMASRHGMPTAVHTRI